MPIRDYKCNHCKADFERRFTSNLVADMAIIICDCGSVDVERKVSKVARARFKGEGFYETTYGKSSKSQ